MWNNRYNPSNTGGSSVTKELDAIRESQLEREQTDDIKIKSEVTELFDDKLFNSLKKILLKVTKAS